MLLLVTSSYAGLTLVPADSPEAVAASPDGSIWYIGSEDSLHRRTPDGRDEQVSLPQPPSHLPYTAIAVSPDGDAWVSEPSETLLRITPDLQVFEFKMSALDQGLSAPVIDRFGNVFVAGYQQFSITRIARDGSTKAFPLPGRPDIFTVDSSGNLLVLVYSHFLRIAPDGGSSQLPIPEFPYILSWMLPLSDGSVLIPGHRIWPDGTMTDSVPSGVAAALGPDGTVWTLTYGNEIVGYRPDGSAFHEPLPEAISNYNSTYLTIAVDTAGRVWATKSAGFAIVDPSTPPASEAILPGDLVTLEEVGNCCFEGTHYEMFHRRPSAFDRRFSDDSWFTGGFAVRPDGTISGDFGIRTEGSFSRWLSDFYPAAGTFQKMAALPASSLVGITLDGSGRTIVTISLGYALDIRRYRHDGVPDGEWLASGVGQESGMASSRIDLASDQCTLYVALTTGELGQIDLCQPYAYLQPVPSIRDVRALRILSAGRLLLGTGNGVFLTSDGSSVIASFLPGAFVESLALDPDGHSFWVGWFDPIAFGGHLSRVDLNNGTVTELRVNGTPAELAIGGEPRAAFRRLRKRAVAHQP
jgi:streptogramin lyase